MSVIDDVETHTEQFQVTVNGEEYDLPAGSSLRDVLRRVDVDPASARGVAVAINEEVVRKEEWSDVTVRAGDRIEVVTATQGG